ncbi:Protein of unknown function [Bacillus cereus]|nr:Protein of unknown function [Bacillus cereus]
MIDLSLFEGSTHHSQANKIQMEDST